MYIYFWRLYRTYIKLYCNFVLNFGYIVCASVILKLSIQVYFRVVKKISGEELAIQYVADCFFTFHHINTFEDNGMCLPPVWLHVAIQHYNVALKISYIVHNKVRQWQQQEKRLTSLTMHSPVHSQWLQLVLLHITNMKRPSTDTLSICTVYMYII